MKDVTIGARYLSTLSGKYYEISSKRETICYKDDDYLMCNVWLLCRILDTKHFIRIRETTIHTNFLKEVSYESKSWG